MGNAIVIKFTLGFFTFGRALVAGLVTTLPLADRPRGLVVAAFAWFNANGVKNLGTQRTNPDIGG